MRRRPAVIAILLLVAASLASAQAGPAPQGAAAVPPVIRFSGQLPMPSGPAVVTFGLYAAETGGEPLWLETQTVDVEDAGRFWVHIGARVLLPIELFSTGEARWLEVSAEGVPAQPRRLLVSVPYALKAADADTIGGRPLSAFLLAGEKTGVGPDGLTYVDARVPAGGLAAAPTGGAGTPHYLGMFTDPTTLGNSVLYQNGTNVGLNTTAPTAALHVAAVTTDGPAVFVDSFANGTPGTLPMLYRTARGTPAAPAAVQVNDILGGLAVRGYGATGWSGGRGQVMYRAAENWTDTAQGTFLQFTTTPLGSATWTERLRVTPDGNVGIGTASPGQRLSVAGTIETTSGGFRFPDGTTQTTAATATSYGAGEGLSLAGTLFSVTFGGTGAAPAAARSDHQHDSRYVSLGGTYANPSWLTSLPTSKLTGNLAVSRITGAATLGANSFGDTQTIASGNLDLPATDSGGKSGVVVLGGQRFMHTGAATTTPNTFVGTNAGALGTSGGGGNVGIGANALAANVTGVNNTAVGAGALQVHIHDSATAFGFHALQNLTQAGRSAFGNEALAAATSGGHDAFGYRAMFRTTTGASNAAFGYQAMFANLTGRQNTAMGYNSLVNSLADDNSAFGYETLHNNTAAANSAFGSWALHANTTATGNSAFGYHALAANSTGASNTAMGNEALAANTTATGNSAFGYHALAANTTSSESTAVGYRALAASHGTGNTAVGSDALAANTGGRNNVALGSGTLAASTAGSDNAAIGSLALYSATGDGNVAVGYHAGFYSGAGSYNTFVGHWADRTGPIGGPSLTNATAIGANALVSQDNSLVLGDTNVSVGIGTTAPNTKLQVVGNIRVGTSGTNGCLQRFDGTALTGTCSSDARLKTDVRPFGRVLDRVVRLQPVHYAWRASDFPEYHFGAGISSGLIAQDVEQVFPEMVSTDERGYKMVDYAELPYLTLQAVKDLKAENDALKAKVATQEAALQALADRLARLEKQ